MLCSLENDIYIYMLLEQYLYIYIDVLLMHCMNTLVIQCINRFALLIVHGCKCCLNDLLFIRRLHMS
jgi:hypothetical protein